MQEFPKGYVSNTSEIDNLYEIADELAQTILSNTEILLNLPKIDELGWKTLPPPSEKPMTMASVDGGSRLLQGRSLYLLFAQAAGRPMGIGGTQMPKDYPWIVERYAEKVSSGGQFASDLLSRIRERLELSVAIDLMERFSPEYMLMDGTLDGLFIIGIPTRLILSTLNGEEDLNDDLRLFKGELIAYGDVLKEFMETAEKQGTKVIGLSKDSYSKIFVPAELREMGINDSMYFSMITQGRRGYSTVNTRKGIEKLKMMKIPKTDESFILTLWKDNKIQLKDDDTNISTFFANFANRGIPVRVDYFANRGLSPDEIIADLQNVSDGKDWFIPPRLAHEKAKVKSDLFDVFVKQIYRRIEASNPTLANLVLGATRRMRTQGG
ncbi:MAG: DNA double-strand break repair nuclease NurA [Methanobacteriota archaeon]|nr:MAG: DNA double-strand break repair nuclease NurA [Euryarchaeota archaeon]